MRDGLLCKAICNKIFLDMGNSANNYGISNFADSVMEFLRVMRDGVSWTPGLYAADFVVLFFVRGKGSHWWVALSSVESYGIFL